ncbi:hypothetical protein C8R45DRAFT_569861 [Mycena sanguinolenta]|nr:hypothetical protein C8R45DRAFT_569861 [Mycena sanguinolenta]
MKLEDGNLTIPGAQGTCSTWRSSSPFSALGHCRRCARRLAPGHPVQLPRRHALVLVWPRSRVSRPVGVGMVAFFRAAGVIVGGVRVTRLHQPQFVIQAQCPTFREPCCFYFAPSARRRPPSTRPCPSPVDCSNTWSPGSPRGLRFVWMCFLPRYFRAATGILDDDAEYS